MIKLSNKGKIKWLRNRKGGLLAYAIIIFAITSLFASTGFFIFNTNLKQATREQERLKAYYLAQSGAELAMTALHKPDGYSSLFKKIAAENSTVVKEELGLEIGDGIVDIKAEQYKKEDDSFDGWVKITSTAKLINGKAEYTRYLLINPTKPYEIVWTNN